MPRIKIVIPYDTAISKNVTLKRSSGGMYKPKAAKKVQIDLALLVRGAINATGGRTRFAHTKIWIKIMVYRPKDPNVSGRRDADPINFLASVADAIKLAINVDDDVFSAVVDWEVDKEAPRIEVVIEQE